MHQRIWIVRNQFRRTLKAVTKNGPSPIQDESVFDNILLPGLFPRAPHRTHCGNATAKMGSG